MHQFSVARFREGDRHEFKYVYHHFYDSIYFFVYSMTKAEDESKDIVAEGFIKLWKLRERFERLENIKAFLFITARNAALDHIRAVKRHQAARKEIHYLGDKDSGEVRNRMIEAEIFAELLTQIESLPRKCKAIFKMIFFDNLSTSEVAEQLQISTGNVLNQKARAIQILRSELVKKSLLELAILLPLFII